MSRIRIVGGTITKTTQGAHNMYSEENIAFNKKEMRDSLDDLKSKLTRKALLGTKWRRRFNK